MDYHNKTEEELIYLLRSFADDKEQLEVERSTLQKKYQEQQEQIIELHQHIQQLLEALKLSQHRQFGMKSEKLDVNQLLLFNEADLPTIEEQAAIEESEREIQVAAHTRH